MDLFGKFSAKNKMSKLQKQQEEEFKAHVARLSFDQLMSPFNSHSTKVPIKFSEPMIRRFVNEPLQRIMESNGVLNWPRVTNLLYPIITLGDGNCLCHSVSFFLWGVSDRKLQLRNLLGVALTRTPAPFKFRWSLEKKYLNKQIETQLGMDVFVPQNYEDEWGRVVAAVTSCGRYYEKNRQYQYLEEIHIFVLANILQRPIIVLSEGVLRNQTGEVVDSHSIGGIYLPLLCNAATCIKSPIVLLYHNFHFLPLIEIETADEICKTRVPGVPLVTKSLESLMVHFLTQEEERRVQDLLNIYLHVREIPFTTESSIEMVPCAKLYWHPWSHLEEYLEIKLQMMVENDQKNNEEHFRWHLRLDS